jgi:hypothetical protein
MGPAPMPSGSHSDDDAVSRTEVPRSKPENRKLHRHPYRKPVKSEFRETVALLSQDMQARESAKDDAATLNTGGHTCVNQVFNSRDCC